MFSKRIGPVERPRGFQKMLNSFWAGKKILLTGHTGFKGAWMTLMLNELGAEVFGFSDDSIPAPSMFDKLNLKKFCAASVVGDIRQIDLVESVITEFNPEIIIHMAAQSLVPEGYVDPIKTFSTNVIGTLNLLEATRTKGAKVRSVVCVTSDKSYENLEKGKPFTELDALGGKDPYSASKSASELVINSYRSSFFNEMNIPICSARAGNVIGGGDWSKDRLIPDIFRSIYNSQPLVIRSPLGIRPWQHVIEPNYGYLKLAAEAYEKGVGQFSSAWNFGSSESCSARVLDLLKLIQVQVPNLNWVIESKDSYKEATALVLSSKKAKKFLDWKTQFSIKEAIELTIEWYAADQRREDMEKLSRVQIKNYLTRVSKF